MLSKPSTLLLPLIRLSLPSLPRLFFVYLFLFRSSAFSFTSSLMPPQILCVFIFCRRPEHLLRCCLFPSHPFYLSSRATDNFFLCFSFSSHSVRPCLPFSSLPYSLSASLPTHSTFTRCPSTLSHHPSLPHQFTIVHPAAPSSTPAPRPRLPSTIYWG